MLVVERFTRCQLYFHPSLTPAQPGSNSAQLDGLEGRFRYSDLKEAVSMEGYAL